MDTKDTKIEMDFLTCWPFVFFVPFVPFVTFVFSATPAG